MIPYKTGGNPMTNIETIEEQIAALRQAINNIESIREQMLALAEIIRLEELLIRQP